MSVRVLALVHAMAICLVASDSPAQTVVPDAPVCPGCRITMQDVVRLDPSSDIPTSPMGVVVDSRGRYWLTFANELAMAFAADGRFITSLREGGGPGEFRYPWLVLPIADSTVVFDRSGGTSVLGPDLSLVRSMQPSRLQGGAIVLNWPDSLLINSGGLVPTGNMSPFHVVSFAGTAPVLARSFGAQEAPPSDPRAYVNLSRIIAPAPSGGVWASQWQKYQLDHWSRSGRLQQTLLREPSWFPAEPQPMNFSSPPPPHVQALHFDGRGLLWVFVSVAAPTWKEGYPRIEPGSGAREFRPEQFSNEKLYQTTVEVIDPAVGRVVARSTIPAYVVTLVGDDLAAVYDTTPAGEPYVRIVRLTIEPGGG